MSERPPPLRLEWRDPAELPDNPDNWRKHPRRQLEGLAAALERVGWAGALLFNEATGHLIDGHARKELRAGERVPVLVGRWTPGQEREILATLDPLAAAAEVDGAALKRLVEQLEGDNSELVALARQLGHLPPPSLAGDDAVEPPAEPTTRPGDLWRLGRHRLLCGDAELEADVARLLVGARPGLMVTDPPYGVAYDPTWRQEAFERGQAWGPPARTGKVANDDRARWPGAWALFPGDVAYVWHGALHATEVAEDLAAAGLEIRAQIIWRKPHAPMSRGHYHWGHEPCWYAVRRGAAAGWQGDRRQSTIWEAVAPGLPYQRQRGEGLEDLTLHGTQKPLELMARPLRNHGHEGVYDPFVGAGTTLIAAEQLGRTCYALDVDPRWVDAAVARWEKLTGGKAERETGGTGADS